MTGTPRMALSDAAPIPRAGALEGLLDEFDVLLAPEHLDDLDADALRDRVALLRRLEGQVAAALATTVRAAASAGVVAADGASSTTAWVRDRLGRSARQATRLVRLGASLPDLPATAAALAAGDVTDEHADVIVRAVADGRHGGPSEVEATLLPVATTAPPERLRAEVRRRAQQVDATAMVTDEARQRARRRLTMSRADDGMWDLSGRLPGEAGAKLRTLLDVFDHPDPEDTPEDRRRRPDQRMADALDTAVTALLDHGDLPTTGGMTRPHLSIIVDHATFAADLSDPDDPDRPVAVDDPIWATLPAGQTHWGTTLSPQATRRTGCDAAISRIVVSGDSQVLDVGRLTRTWSAPQRRAIAARDRGCRGPGCDRPIAWTQIHHIQWWRHDGPTDVDNGIGLCDGCHGLVHDDGWHLELDPATAIATWTSPDGRRTVVTHPRPPG